MITQQHKSQTKKYYEPINGNEIYFSSRINDASIYAFLECNGIIKEKATIFFPFRLSQNKTVVKVLLTEKQERVEVPDHIWLWITSPNTIN